MPGKKFKNILRACPFPTLVKLSLENRPQFKYLPRLVQMYIDSILLAPVNMIESQKYKKPIRQHIIEKEPVFIIGHWRCGTTFLHNLMTQDPQFGFARLFHTIFPKGFIMIAQSKIASKLVLDKIDKFMPKKRIFDNMELRLDLPQEEEFGIARLVPYSFYHSFSYPQNSGSLFNKYVLLKDIPGPELEALKNSYIFFLKKLSYAWGGKQLILKNPVNTARIGFLLSIFPKAKFIHISRDPLDIFESTRNMRAIIGKVSQLNSIPDRQLEENIIRQYKDLMEAYLKQKELIPGFQLSETRYEDLAVRPVKEIERIYHDLQLDFTGEAKAALDRYLSTIKDYKKNRFTLSRENRERIRRHWAFALEKWGTGEGKNRGQGRDRRL